MEDKIAKRHLPPKPFHIDVYNEKVEVKITSPEYLSKDIIDENFFQTFSLLYRFQYIMGSCRLDARNRFATPPTTAQKIYTIVCLIQAGLANCVMGQDYISHVKNNVLRYIGISCLILQYISYASNITHARFFNSNENVDFFVKMQKIDRLLKIDRWKILNQWVRNLTNIPLACTILLCVILMLWACVEQGFSSLYLIGPAYSMLALLFELTSCTSIIAYFMLRMMYINCLIENHLSQETNLTPPSKRFVSRSYLKFYAQKNHNYYETSDTHIYLRELFQCFAMYQNLYRFQLFTFCLQSVAASILTFELLLYSMRDNSSTLLEISTYIVFTILDVCGALFLVVRYELFFDEVRETKRLCINLMARHQDGPLREKARKMLKMIDETPPRFSVYEMWEMNAATFLSMFVLTTSLVVASLQFEFL